MSTKGKEYKLAIRIAGIIDKSFTTSLAATNTSLRSTLTSVNNDFLMLDKGFNKIATFGKRCFKTIATAAGVAAVAIGAAAVAAVKVGSEFEAQMSTVQTISGATSDEMVLLSNKARELAESSVFSAKEVGNAMEYMGMAGWKTEQILAGICGVLDLAAASGEDFSLVSDIVTDDLTAFNMTADETQRMVDVMAQAAMNSNTNVAMMGDTFKYAGAVAGAMGYQIEDIAIATGLMASSGVKASMAGTTLRNIITRMAKPTKESSEAMKALGLSLEKGDGTMYSFLEIMEKLRSSMKGMSATQKAYYAAELGGQRGMTGLLAIANASDEEFKQLTDSIYNANGAAAKMAEIRLDNLSGDAEIFKDTVKDAGIEFYYQFNDQLRGAVQFGTDIVSSAKVNIPKYFNAISAEFPTLQRKFKKYAGPVIDSVFDFGKWIFKNGKVVVSVLAGVGAAMASYKVASTTVHFITSLMKLFSMNPVTWGILGVVAAIGAITGAIVAYKQHEAELRDDSLSKHFGDIVLSMEDLQKVAEHIISSKSLTGVQEALAAFGKLDEFSNTMENAIEYLNKMNWKVSIGMKLSEDEQGQYKTTIQEYVTAAQEYALQSQYAVSLNLKVGLGDSTEGASIATKVEQFYQDSYDEMTSLGQSMSDAVNKAFADGVLDPKEVDQIANLQAKIAEVQQSLATGEFDAKLSMLGLDYAGGSRLDADSFMNLQNELNNQVAIAAEAYKESYTKNYASVSAARSSGTLTDSEFNTAIQTLKDEYLQNIADLNMKSATFQLDTIIGSYAEEMATVQSSIDSVLTEMMGAGYSTPEDWRNGLNNAMYDVEGSLEKGDRLALGELYVQLKPQLEQMKTLAAEYTEAGKAIPEEISTAIDNIYAIGAASGDEVSMWETFGRYFSENEEYATVIALAQEAGSTIPQEIIDAMTNEGVMADINENVDYILESIKTGLQEGIDITIPVYYELAHYGIQYKKAGVAASDININALSGVEGEIGHRANGGLATRPELTWFAENGPEMAIPIDGSRNAISLWEKTGRLLGMNSVLDGVDLGGSNGPSIEYSPTLQFYGEAPSKDDLTDALRISQDEFDSLMDRYFKNRGRMAFG